MFVLGCSVDQYVIRNVGDTLEFTDNVVYFFLEYFRCRTNTKVQPFVSEESDVCVCVCVCVC